jgi:hypothetical protein
VERLVVTKAEAGQAGRSALHHAELRASLRGARGEDGEQVKLVAVFDHAEHLALSQVEVVGGDELAAFAPVLDTVPDLRGVVVTADALHCQPTPAEYLHGRGAHYLFTVQGNQPTLRQALARLPWARCPGCATGRSATPAPSPARSRFSTWTPPRRPGCSHTAPG